MNLYIFTYTYINNDHSKCFKFLLINRTFVSLGYDYRNFITKSSELVFIALYQLFNCLLSYSIPLIKIHYKTVSDFRSKLNQLISFRNP